jgi:hypothetical protein
MYVSFDGMSGWVRVWSASGESVLTTIYLPRMPRAMCWNPTWNRTYVAQYFGSRITVLRDSGGGIEESFKPQAASYKPAATVVRSVLLLPEAVSGGRSAVCAQLLDIGGRKVLDLKPGANDVRALAPGVYFVREERAQAQAQVQAARKVIVTR